MKRALIVAAAVGLLAPAVAMAQSGEPKQHGETAPAAGAPNRGGAMQPQQARPQMARPQGMGPMRQEQTNLVRPLPPRGQQFWHRGQYYGRVQAPPFVYPRGWGYRQWWIGGRLPPLFVSPGYYYPDWAALGLQAPVPGYVWVRFGPDLLLVNLVTNEIEDVVYGAFQ